MRIWGPGRPGRESVPAPTIRGSGECRTATPSGSEAHVLSYSPAGGGGREVGAPATFDPMRWDFDKMGLELNSPISRKLHFAPFPSLIIEVIHEGVAGIKSIKSPEYTMYTCVSNN